MSDLPFGFSHTEYCDMTLTATDYFAQVSREMNPKEPIPTCPEWTLAGLVRHTGMIHRWVTAMVLELSTEPLDRRSLDLALPDDDRWLPGWLEAGGEALVDALDDSDPREPMWSFGPDQNVGFWARRMLHETTIHRIDAERRPFDAQIIPAIAADGIDERLFNLQAMSSFRPQLAELRGEGTIAFTALDRVFDGSASWLVTLDPDGFDVARVASSEARAADVHLHGVPDLLWFAIYDRIRYSSPGLSVSGDLALLNWWIETTRA